VIFIGREWRPRSVISVMDEIAEMERHYGVEYGHVYFSDANFFVDYRRALEVGHALQSYREGMTYSFSSRVNQIVRARSQVGDLRASGCTFVEMGVESASPAVLRRLGKGTKPQDNVNAVRLLRRAGIDIELDFIMYDPETTVEDLVLNSAFLRDNGFYDYVPHSPLYTALILYAGAPITNYYEELFGTSFDPDVIPDTAALFVHPEVRQIYHANTEYRRKYGEAVTTEMRALENAIRVGFRSVDAGRVVRSARYARLLQRAQLQAVALRHAPYRFFAQSLDHARRTSEDFECDDVLSEAPSLGPKSLIMHATEIRDHLERGLGEHLRITPRPDMVLSCPR
jgi:radical SAM superfamily enzyme YgiQ (UPF0313 family)